MNWVGRGAAAAAVLVAGCAGPPTQRVAPGRPATITAAGPATTTTAPSTTTSASPTTMITTTTQATKATTRTTMTTKVTTTVAAAGRAVARRRVPPSPAPTGRVVHDQAWTPFATVGPVVLRHPSSRVERVGFHESNHDGARELEPLATAVAPMTLEGRDRGTGSRTAADVVVDPEVEIRAPVSGTVRRAGTYVLYCDYSDDFAVIEPDDRPGWEVKVLHIDGVAVGRGDRVEAGLTVLAARPTPLPFASQIDDVTAKPSWPHVHMEVVDPSIPDRPSGRGC